MLVFIEILRGWTVSFQIIILANGGLGGGGDVMAHSFEQLFDFFSFSIWWNPFREQAGPQSLKNK